MLLDRERLTYTVSVGPLTVFSSVLTAVVVWKYKASAWNRKNKSEKRGGGIDSDLDIAHGQCTLDCRDNVTVHYGGEILNDSRPFAPLADATFNGCFNSSPGTVEICVRVWVRAVVVV